MHTRVKKSSFCHSQFTCWFRELIEWNFVCRGTGYSHGLKVSPHRLQRQKNIPLQWCDLEVTILTKWSNLELPIVTCASWYDGIPPVRYSYWKMFKLNLIVWKQMENVRHSAKQLDRLSKKVYVVKTKIIRGCWFRYKRLQRRKNQR